ncbi:MAG: hypothetical protein WCJ85_07625 [Chitinophagaceae bacterium]
MIKKLSFLLSLLILLQFIAHAQVALVATTGSDITIKSGTVFSVDNITLTPSADFTISNNTLTRASTVIHTPSFGTYINRVYQFTNTSNPYSGAIQINYLDGAELNGLAESGLTLNLHNGTRWNPYAATTRDATNNFVLTNGLSNINLNELTLSDLNTPLPILWKSFTVTKQNNHGLLQWVTSMEQGSKNFTVQTSITGTVWITLATVPAAGYSSTDRNYSYVHMNPIKGANFYRIVQTNMDNSSTLSAVKQLNFDGQNEDYRILNNPVNNGIQVVEVYTANIFTLYNAAGELIWKAPLAAGTHFIQLSRYAKGSYFFTNGNHTQKISVQ